MWKKTKIDFLIRNKDGLFGNNNGFLFNIIFIFAYLLSFEDK